ncbi:MAG: hypothetical protein ACE5HN_08445 [Nitrospiria bacterium]
MKCQRCQGMMVEERIFTQQGGVLIARCIHCGDVVDRTVIFNRGRFPIRFRKIEGGRRGCQSRFRLSA